ncbi:MAG: Spy/CpxP family protein refolding chaperone [Rhodoferax sp.]
MKLLSKHTLLAGLLATAGFATLAQTPPPASAPTQMQMQQHDPAQWRAKMAERHAKHMAKLKTELGITPQQQGAWNSFAEAMQPPAPPQQASREHMRAEFAKMTTPERIDKMRALRDRRAALVDQRDIATKTFYAALSPDQQQKFDNITLRMMQRHGKHDWHHGPQG